MKKDYFLGPLLFIVFILVMGAGCKKEKNRGLVTLVTTAGIIAPTAFFGPAKAVSECGSKRKSLGNGECVMDEATTNCPVMGNAGDITFSKDNTMLTAKVVLKTFFGITYLYQHQNLTDPLWTQGKWNGAGELYSVSAAGGVADMPISGAVAVPAFNGKIKSSGIITADNANKKFSDFFSSINKEPSARTAITLRWTGHAADEVVLVQIVIPENTVINCRFAASAGSGTIPSEALAYLNATAGATNAVTVSNTVVNVVDVSDWEIELMPLTPAEGIINIQLN